MKKNNTEGEPKPPLPVGAQSTCCQPGFAQRLPTLAYGKHTLTYTHTQTCTRMHVHAVTISGSGVLEFGRRLIMSECHIFMHECAVFMHADLVTFADMQTHTHTYTYTERQQMCSACIHKQPSDQTLSYIRGKFEVSWTDKCCRTAVAPFLLHGSFRGSRAAWFFRKSRQNYWQSTA